MFRLFIVKSSPTLLIAACEQSPDLSHLEAITQPLDLFAKFMKPSLKIFP